MAVMLFENAQLAELTSSLRYGPPASAITPVP